MIQGKGYVGGRLLHECPLRLTKEIRFAGIEGEHASSYALFADGQGRQTKKARFTGEFPPGQGTLIGPDIVADAGPVFADTGSAETLARRFLIDRDFNALQVSRGVALLGLHQNASGGLFHPTDPGEAELHHLGHDAADGLEKLLAGFDPYHRFV